MRLAFSAGATMLALIAVACSSDGEGARLAQVGERDVRPPPLPDGAVVEVVEVVDSGGPDVVDDASECGADDECHPPGACLVGRCVRGSCRFDFADDGVGCDDGDPCTTLDACSGGECRGSGLTECSDGDACTNDECRAGVGCVSTPIACPPASSSCVASRCDPSAGCVEEPIAGACDHQCDGRAPGAACDDGDADTTADMCLAGKCRGYALTRIAGDAVSDQEGLVVAEIDDGPSGWDAVLWTEDFFLDQSWLLARVDDPTSPMVFEDTLQTDRFAGLDDGAVGDDTGHVWVIDGAHWTVDNPWDAALEAAGRDSIEAIFGERNVGGDHARVMWIAGGTDGEWVRACREQGQHVVCVPQSLGSQDEASVPQAIAGVAGCSGGTCSGATLAIGADAWVGGGFSYTDVYVNPSGFVATWSPGFVPDQPANRATRALAGWADDGGHSRFVAVGDHGYLLVRRANGSWHGPVALVDGQAARDFSGVWAGAGAVIVSATRAGTLGQTIFELWVAPLTADLERGDSWSAFELGRYDAADADGLYDVAGRGNGEVRVVGAVRREDAFADWLDGALWVRKP